MNWNNVRWVRRQGYPHLLVEIEGIEADIPWEQKPTLTAQKIIYLGSDFKESHTVQLRGDLAQQVGVELRGFTDDAAFFDAVYLPFARAIANGTFRPTE